MPSISVPKSFFESERNTIYADWTEAFWRELLSNSIDSGAKSIMVKSRYLETGNLKVTVFDNGCGMDRRIIEDVYMQLGASTKGGDGAIGGFGRARILTCFSQNAYRIRTSDLEVQGEGSEYTIRNVGKSVKGTAMTVDIDAKYAHRLHRGLRKVLRQSHLSQAIILDVAQKTSDGADMHIITEDQVKPTDRPGQLRFSAWSYKGTKFEVLKDDDGPWADLHISKGKTANSGLAVIRVNGMAMFTESVKCEGQVTVDLTPERAREVLTATRDSVRPEYRSRLQDVYTQIATEQMSMFRARSAEPVRKIHSYAGMPVGMALMGQPAKITQPDMTPSTTQGLNAGNGTTARPAPRPASGMPSEIQKEPAVEINLDAEWREFGSPLLNPVATMTENPTPQQRSVMPRYSGAGWIAGQGEGRTSELLHAAWTAACRHAIGALCKLQPDLQYHTGDTWATGFIFDTDMLGCHAQIGDVRHCLLLNPVDDAGRARYKLSDPQSMKSLIATALHEVTHIVRPWHDESFAKVFTDLVGSVRDKDIEKDIKEEMAAARNLMSRRDSFVQDLSRRMQAAKSVDTLDAPGM